MNGCTNAQTAAQLALRRSCLRGRFQWRTTFADWLWVVLAERRRPRQGQIDTPVDDWQGERKALPLGEDGGLGTVEKGIPAAAPLSEAD